MTRSDSRGTEAGPKPFAITYVIGTAVILAVAFAIYDAARGRELQPVGYAIWVVLFPFAMIAGRAIYIRRMRRRARREA